MLCSDVRVFKFLSNTGSDYFYTGSDYFYTDKVSCLVFINQVLMSHLRITFCGRPGGSSIELTNHTADDYVSLSSEFILCQGIREQMAAFRDGFNQVFPIEKLNIFTPEEVRVLISGEPYPNWDKTDLLTYTEPKSGYTKDNAFFHTIVDVLNEFSPAERKLFLHFSTGCPSLPPGGLVNLHPRMQFVKSDVVPGKLATRVCISGVRGYVYPGYEGMYIRGTRVFMYIRGTRVISGVRESYLGYEGMHIWVRGYAYLGYESHIWGTRVCISGVRGYAYPGYEGMHIRGTRVCISGVRL